MIHANQIVMLHNLNLYSALCYISIKLEEKWIIKCNCFRFENKEIYKKCVCVCVLLITQSYPTLCDPITVACQAPLSMGILLGRMLEWVAMPSSRGSLPPPGDLPNPGIEPRCPTLHVDSLLSEPPGKPKNTGVGSLSLLQRIFLTQELNQSLLHCVWILYQLSYQGSPCYMGHAAAAAAKSLQSCLTLCDPIDGSPPGSSVPGILQARTLEWVAMSFSNAWKWRVKVKSLSRVRILATPWSAAYQAPPPVGFSRQEYWSGSPLPSPGVCITLEE